MTELHKPITTETITSQFDASLADVLPVAIQHTNESFTTLKGAPIRWSESKFQGLANPPYLHVYLNDEHSNVSLKLPLNPSPQDIEILQSGYGVSMIRRGVSIEERISEGGVSHVRTSLTLPHEEGPASLFRATSFEDGRDPEVLPSDELDLESIEGQAIARYVLAMVMNTGPIIGSQHTFIEQHGTDLRGRSVFELASTATHDALSAIGIKS